LNRHQAEFVALLAAVRKIAHGCRALPVKCVAFFEDDTHRNNLCAKFFIFLSVMHQSSWKFCIHLNFGFVALQPEHQFLHAVVTFCLRAWEETSLPRISTLRWQKLGDVEFWHAGNVRIIPQQQPYHSHSRNLIRNSCRTTHSSSVNLSGILTAPPQNHTAKIPSH